MLYPQHQHLGRPQASGIIDAGFADSSVTGFFAAFSSALLTGGNRFLFFTHELFLLYPSDSSPHLTSVIVPASGSSRAPHGKRLQP